MSDLLPNNATPWERAVADAAERVGGIPVPLRTLRDPDTIAAHLLPWLAWEESVDNWSSEWTETQKRGVIKASLTVHQKKGTVAALKAALQGLGYDIRVREWFQQTPRGDPYTFECYFIVDQVGIADPAAFGRVVDTVSAAKNLRSYLEGVDILGLTRAGTHFGGKVLSGEIVTIAAGNA